MLVFRGVNSFSISPLGTHDVRLVKGKVLGLQDVLYF